jgi:hypothetical protein
VAGSIAHRRDDDVGPEERAVLPQPPAFVLEAALGGGDLQFLLRNTLLDPLLRIEAREVLAEDLVLTIALEALRSGVPADDSPVGIEHENRVVDDAFDQHAKLLVGLHERQARSGGRAGGRAHARFRRVAFRCHCFCRRSLCDVIRDATDPGQLEARMDEVDSSDEPQHVELEAFIAAGGDAEQAPEGGLVAVPLGVGAKNSPAGK